MSKRSKRRQADDEVKAKRQQPRGRPAWLLPVVVLLIAFAVVALAMVANQSPTR